jgi:hypothetical protein
VAVQIQITAPGLVPSPTETLGNPRFTEPRTVRGLKASDGEGSTLLWLADGTVITVHSPAEMRADILRQLRSANHAIGGIRDVGPGQNLSDLNEFRRPTP